MFPQGDIVVLPCIKIRIVVLKYSDWCWCVAIMDTEILDKSIKVVLKDGRIILGELCSIDKYKTLVASNCQEFVRNDTQTKTVKLRDLGLTLIPGSAVERLYCKQD